MRASNGAYFQGLDHVRAVAAVLVYWWHVLHLYVPPQYHPPLFMLSWFEEGHTGVALFMALSGYLFAKLTDGCRVDTLNFLWNRACRLLPLFVVMYAFYAVTERYTLGALLSGFLFPKEWPGASWSLAIELQFYIAFPVLLWLRNRFGGRAANVALIGIVTACVAARGVVWFTTGSVEHLAYWTILGRADQFAMGMLFYELSKTPLLRERRGALLIGTIAVILLVFHALNLDGGAFDAFPKPSASPHWVWLPLFEGVSYGCLIMCYDTMPWKLTGRVFDALARLGELSYSIYLIHSALVMGLLYRFMPIETPLWIVVTAGVAFFPIVVMLAHLSYTYIEKPFLRHRRPYLTMLRQSDAGAADRTFASAAAGSGYSSGSVVNISG